MPCWRSWCDSHSGHPGQVPTKTVSSKSPVTLRASVRRCQIAGALQPGRAPPSYRLLRVPRLFPQGGVPFPHTAPRCAWRFLSNTSAVVLTCPVNRATNRSFAPCVPYQEFLAYADEITRVKFRLASSRAARWFGVLTRAGCESLWRALPLSTNRLRPISTGLKRQSARASGRQAGGDPVGREVAYGEKCRRRIRTDKSASQHE